MILKAEIQQIIDSQSDSMSREAAEHLVDSGKIHIATLNDSFIKGRVESINVELHLKSNSLHLQSNCGCLKKNNQLCIHGLAFLMHLTHHLKSERSTKGVKFWRQMVRDMDQDSLSRLVIDFARRNKSFAMELQALNVAQPGDADPFEMAEELLHSIKSPIIKSVKKPSTTQVRLAINTCKALLKSATSLVDGDYPVEGSKILVKIIETIHYISHKRKSMDSTSTKIIKRAHDEILDRLKGLRAPEVNEQLYQDIIQLISKSYYSPINETFLPELFQHLKLTSHQSGFILAVETHIQRSEGFYQNRWLEIWLVCLLSIKDGNISSYKPGPIELLAIWKLLIKIKPDKVSSELMDMLYADIPHSVYNEAFALALLTDHLEHATSLLRHADVDLYFLSENQAREVLNFVGKNNVQINPQHHLTLLELSNNIQEISEYIDSNNTLDITAEIIHLNTPKNAFICFEQLKPQIDEFLIHHIGPASRKVVFKLLDGLEESQNKELLKTVKQYLSEEYGIENDMSLKNITGLLHS